jgi:hypothetical protein
MTDHHHFFSSVLLSFQCEIVAFTNTQGKGSLSEKNKDDDSSLKDDSGPILVVL